VIFITDRDEVVEWLASPLPAQGPDVLQLLRDGREDRP